MLVKDMSLNCQTNEVCLPPGRNGRSRSSAHVRSVLVHSVVAWVVAHAVVRVLLVAAVLSARRLLIGRKTANRT